MDFQTLVNAMSDASSSERANYHLTYGDLIKVLKAAPKEAVFDERIKGIGSYRGYYVDIALFTEDSGYSIEDQEYFGGYGDDYRKWEEEHVSGADSLPTNANELGALLESLIGNDFSGWKGGNYKITEDKPLWLEETQRDCTETAIIGIDENLKLITKALEES